MIIGLDVRTRRGRTQRVAAPENLSPESLAEQIPEGGLPAGNEVLVLVSSLTVLGPPVIDAILGPMLYKIFDLKGHLNSVEMPGLDPDAIESWPNNELAFERLLDRLEPYAQVVILSGDVHFSDSSALSYFKKGGSRAARYAQFTSSGMKNLFKVEIRKAGQIFAFLQHMIQAKIDVGRVAWKKSVANLLDIPSGANVPPRHREKLEQSPVLLSTDAWPPGTREKTDLPPDWAWRVHIIRDGRPDAQRPEPTRPQPLIPGDAGADIAPILEGYRRVAHRHSKQLDNLNHDRQMMFASNLGVIRFERATQGPTPVLTATQNLFAVHLPPFDKQAELYTRHEVVLTADAAEARPVIAGL
jgi:hypothetical protein